MSTSLTRVQAPTRGERSLRTSAAILEHGHDPTSDGLPIREIMLAVLSVDDPDPDGGVIASTTTPSRAV